MLLTDDQVSSLAPDARALGAGRRTADARLWAGLGQSAAALWGECTGSAVYQVTVSLADLASACSCPSGKAPWKHALGLMFLFAGEPGRLLTGEPPEWATEWLETRSDAVARQKGQGDRPSRPPDPEARARRASKRAQRVLAGIEGLELWMGDLVRTGLAAAAARGDQTFHDQAAHLVDAQAPGLASRVRRLAGLSISAPDFGERAADTLGRLALLTHAFRRLPALPPPLAADVRALVGFTLDREEVMAAGERVTDEWAVVGQQVDDDERLSVQRTWLFGLTTARTALVLQFAPGGAPFAEAIPPGVVFGAELAFWPGAFPVRAVVSRREGEARTLTARPAGLRDLEGLLAAYADALARQPWLDRIPAGLSDVVPVVLDATVDRFELVDTGGRSVRLVGRGLWELFALAGGHPVDVFGDWDGRAFMPFGAFADGRLHGLGTGAVEA